MHTGEFWEEYFVPHLSQLVAKSIGGGQSGTSARDEYYLNVVQENSP